MQHRQLIAAHNLTDPWEGRGDAAKLIEVDAGWRDPIARAVEKGVRRQLVRAYRARVRPNK
eukprot:4501197-Prymnesium_polylepis.1